MKLKFLLAASVASIATIALPAPVVAQQITSGIDGRVTDEGGMPIGGATVTVTDTRTGAARTLTTNASGSFTASNLVTGGPYTVSASADGFEGQTVEGIATTLQGNTNLTFSLTAGGGEIVVSGARVQVTQLAVGPGTSFTAEVLENAPSFNRDIRDVIRIDPRVSLDRDDGGSGQDRISCLGGNDRANAFTVDGISQGDIYGLNDTGFSSRSSTPIPYDAVRETQVQFAPFDVDYGNFTGCAINVVTKSGSNVIHGGGYFEYSDNGLRGDSVKGVAVAPLEPEKRWGVNLGGPIIPDRLFIFGAYEHQEAAFSQDDGLRGDGSGNDINEVTVAQFNEITGVLRDQYGIDSGPLVTSRPFTNDRYFVRADLQLTDRHRLEGTYQRLEETTVKPDDLASSGTYGGTIVGRNTFLNSGTESNYYSGRLYSQWSDAFSTEVRYSRSEVQDLQDPIGGGEAQSDNPIPRIVVGVDNGTAAAGAVEVGPGFSRSANDLQTTVDQLRVAATAEYQNHTFKAGVEWNHASLFNLFVQNATGTLVFRNIDDLRAGILANGSGTTNSPGNAVSGNVSGAFGNFSSTGDVRDAAAAFSRDIYSVFVQDEWQATDRMLVTAGVRADLYAGDAPTRNERFVERYGFPNNFGFDILDPLVMPRLAVSYDLDDFAVFSRSNLRGGVGIFSGGDPLVWFGNAFQNNGIGFATGTTADAACPAGPIDVYQNGAFTGIPQCIVDSAAAQASRGLGDAQSISGDIIQPSVVRANIGFQSDLDFAQGGLLSGWHVNLDYIYSEYRNPLTLVDLSQTPDIRKGVNGYTIDGRPIYAAIDPTVAGCNATLVDRNPGPVWDGVTAACFSTSRDDELQLANAGAYSSHVASIFLSKSFRNGGLFTSGGSGFLSFGYSFTDAHDRRNMYNSTAGSNYDNSAAFDRQNPDVSRGFYSSKHNFTVSGSLAEAFFGDNETRLNFTFVARSGRPYSLTFGGSGVWNDSSSGNDNSLVYLPTGVDDPNIAPTSNMTAVQGLVDWASNYGCAKDYLGQTIPRNTCSNDWYFDLDLSLSQEIPGPLSFAGVKNDKLKLYASMDNFLNLLDSSWNVQNRRNYVGLQDVASSTGVDAAGRYIITGFNGADSIASDNQINFSSSVWRLKVGVSYDF